MFDEHTWQYKNIPSAVVLTLGNKVILCALTEGVLIYIYSAHEKSCQMCTCLIMTVFELPHVTLCGASGQNVTK